MGLSYEQEVALMQLDAEERERWRRRQQNRKPAGPKYSNVCDTGVRALAGQTVAYLFGTTRVAFTPENPEHLVPRWFAERLDKTKWRIVKGVAPVSAQADTAGNEIRARYSEEVIEDLISAEELIDSMAIELREAAMRVRNNPSVPHVQAVEAVIEKIGTGNYRSAKEASEDQDEPGPDQEEKVPVRKRNRDTVRTRPK
jgi:hypothetical protein